MLTPEDDQMKEAQRVRRAAEVKKLKQSLAVQLNLEQAELLLEILKGAGSEAYFPGADALRAHLKAEVAGLISLLPR